MLAREPETYTVGTILRLTEAVSYTHLDVYKRQVLAVSSPDILFSAVTLQQVMESLLLSW